MAKLHPAPEGATAAAMDMQAALEKTYENLSGLTQSQDDVFASMLRRIDRVLCKAGSIAALKRAESDLQHQLTASKGGEVCGVTEDHRYQMAQELSEVRAVIAKAPAA